MRKFKVADLAGTYVSRCPDFSYVRNKNVFDLYGVTQWIQ